MVSGCMPEVLGHASQTESRLKTSSSGTHDRNSRKMSLLQEVTGMHLNRRGALKIRCFWKTHGQKSAKTILLLAPVGVTVPTF
jgi:hypothetical protein